MSASQVCHIDIRPCTDACTPGNCQVQHAIEFGYDLPCPFGTPDCYHGSKYAGVNRALASMGADPLTDNERAYLDAH